MAKNDSSEQGLEGGMPTLTPAQPGMRVTETLTPNLATEQAIAEASRSANTSRPVISVRGLTKTYHVNHGTDFTALRGISLEVQPGEFVAIMGPSGSGKSTLMNLLGCLDTPTSGEYIINGQKVNTLSSDKLADIRNQTLGFVFQSFNLLDRATALKNVELPMRYAGYSRRDREQRARKLLTLVGMETRMHHKPNELSGGQQQRIAIARALVNGPSLLLADEPSGNLDSKTSIEIMAVLQALNEQGLTIILITHDRNIAGYAGRLVQLLDGRIVSDVAIPQPHSAVEDWLALENRASPKNTVEATGVKTEPLTE